jgi:hypothetical protein
MATAQRKTQWAVTSVALTGVAAHLIWPNLKIDTIALALLFAAAIPWLLPLFKEIEFPGGLKLEFQELQAAEQRAAQVGLLAEAPPPASARYERSFEMIADEDPNLALAGLRIEIEKRLNRLAQDAGVAKKMSVGQSLRVLGDKGILTHEQSTVLNDMVWLLNSAVHGATVDQKSTRWALEVGPRLLATLDKKIPQRQ